MTDIDPLVDSLTRLVSSFRLLPRISRPEPTFMQIAGYPHLENVASNILTFYLKPDRPHGLGSLVLETLLAVAGLEPASAGSVTDVRTEEWTRTNKRIDIVVEADTFVLGIENKIFHTINNPFPEYRRHLRELSRGRNVYGIVLALHTREASEDLLDFRLVSYDAFFTRLMEQLGGHILDAREPYLTYLRDFVRTVRDLRGGSGMDAKLIAYFAENRSTVEVLLNETNALREHMRQRVKQLADAINDTVVDPPFISGLWRPARELYDIAWFQVNLTEQVVLQIDVVLTPTGWHISLYNHLGERDDQRTALRTYLAEHHVETRHRMSRPWRLAYGADDLSYSADLSLVQARIQQLFMDLGNRNVS